MEYLQDEIRMAIQNFMQNIDLGIVFIYLFAGELAKKVNILNKLNTALKTVIIGTILASIYSYAMYLQTSELLIAKVLFSLTFSITCYDILLKTVFKKLIDWIGEKLGINQPKEQANTTTDACECIENDFYEAREMSPSDLSALLTSGDHFEDFVYCEEMIYISTLDENHQPQIQSYFVGTRPPKKPVRI